jgi:hypothetical protein
VDHVARILAPELSRVLGRSVVVENVPGANSARAVARVASSEPNGDTLLLASSAIAHPDNAAAAASLRPVILASTAPMVLVVRASLPAHDPREFAAYLAAHAGASYGSSGVGNPTHLAAARLVEHLRADAVHVPYSGSALAFADLVAGRIDFMMTASNSSVGGHGAVRALAVTTVPGPPAGTRPASDDRRDARSGLRLRPVAGRVRASTLPDAAVAALNAQLPRGARVRAGAAALAEGGVEIVGVTCRRGEHLPRGSRARPGKDAAMSCESTGGDGHADDGADARSASGSSSTRTASGTFRRSSRRPRTSPRRARRRGARSRRAAVARDRGAARSSR